MTRHRSCKSCIYWGVSYNNDCSFIDIDPSGNDNIYIVYKDSDNSGHDVTIRTSPDFSCINHIHKET